MWRVACVCVAVALDAYSISLYGLSFDKNNIPWLKINKAKSCSTDEEKKMCAGFFFVLVVDAVWCGIASPETKGHTTNKDIICRSIGTLSIWRATEFQPANFAHSKFNTFFVVGRRRCRFRQRIFCAYSIISLLLSIDLTLYSIRVHWAPFK